MLKVLWDVVVGVALAALSVFAKVGFVVVMIGPLQMLGLPANCRKQSRHQAIKSTPRLERETSAVSNIFPVSSGPLNKQVFSSSMALAFANQCSHQVFVT